MFILIFKIVRDVKFYQNEEKKEEMENPETVINRYSETQKEQNLQTVDEIQAIAHGWLKKMRYMIVQLQSNKAVDTTDFKCDKCQYKKFY